MKFEEKILKFIAKYRLLSLSKPVLVALSGGADSVALLLVLRKLGYEVAAAHCNFHLRGEESNRDEEFVRQLCHSTRTPLYVADFDTRKEAALRKESIEMAARRLRYDWFARLRAEKGYERVAVAHHRDDNVETFFLNLVRGTSLRGLAGMRPMRDNIVRPLLCVSRAEIEDWLKEQHQTFVTDSTNSDTEFRRNKIRHELLPIMREINPSFDSGLSKTMQRLYELEEMENGKTLMIIGKAMSILPDGIALNAEALRNEPLLENILFRVLSHYHFTPAVIEDVAKKLGEPQGRLYKEGNYLLSCNPRLLEIRRQPAELKDTAIGIGTNTLPDGSTIEISTLDINDLPEPEEAGKQKKRFATPPEVAYIDRACIEGKMVCRSLRSGDKFSPFGMRGSKLINDFLAERGFSRIDRLATKVVCDERKILWIVGVRIANSCAVSERTKEIVRLELK